MTGIRDSFGFDQFNIEFERKWGVKKTFNGNGFKRLIIQKDNNKAVGSIYFEGDKVFGEFALDIIALFA